MVKKRKGAKPFGQSDDTESVERPSKLDIKTYEDVADSEDEFHLNRDKILLEEEPEDRRKRQLREKDEFLELDEEALGDFNDSDSDVDDGEQYDDEEDVDLEDGDEAGNESEEDEGWGHTKSDYYNADVIETEQDALDEEAEALRIQKKQLQSMQAADFGFDEDEWATEGRDGGREEDEEQDTVTEVLPQLQLTDDMSNDERLKMLKSRYPEFDYLSKDFVDLQPLHNELSLAVTAARKLGTIKEQPRLLVKYQSLAAYLSAIAMYFALLTSTFDEGKSTITAIAPQELRDHPVIDSLVQSRTLWDRVKELDTTEDASLILHEEPDTVAEMPVVNDEQGNDVAVLKAPIREKKSRAQKASEKAQAEAEARLAERRRKTEEELANLSILTKQSKARAPATATKPPQISEDGSDLGEENDLTAEELAEKARRKKSLKFYTSQITQKANKRSSARRDYGGDMDVPHRERLRDRQTRLNAEAEKRGKRKADQRDELGGESDEEDRRQARDVRGEDQNDEDDYYDMVAARSKKRKIEKSERAEAYAQAAREGGQVIEEEVIGPDGKRAITYAISKNKGLTPRRKKDVRNPRVKKRKKYDEKKKKLKSMKPVYSGGEQKGGYQGELTGIKKGLVKSIKL